MPKLSKLILLSLLLSHSLTASKNCPTALEKFIKALDWSLEKINPFELYTASLIGTPHTRLVTPEFFQDSQDGSIVGINGVRAGEMYQSAADYMTGAPWKNQEHIFQERVIGPRDMFESLLKAYQKRGPIKKLVIAAHGAPGKLLIHRVPPSRQWVEKNKDLYKDLPKDLFAPNAQIVLISCRCGQGFVGNSKFGETRLRELWGPLLQQGGTIYASNRYVDPEYHQIPMKYKSNPERIARHLASPVLAVSESVNWLISDWTSKIKKVREIPIEAKN